MAKNVARPKARRRGGVGTGRSLEMVQPSFDLFLAGEFEVFCVSVDFAFVDSFFLCYQKCYF